jgi:peroxiredoxin Q/BCP
MKRNRLTLLSAVLVSLSLGAAAACASTLPEVGSAAPDFQLKSQDGKLVSLKDYRGKWVVLYFYPKDMTPGCTIQAKNFQRDLAAYTKANAVIIGVSVDNTESHQAFCAKESLTFKLLSDTEVKVSEAYGSARDYNGNKLSARNTFLIDPEGKIAKVYPSVKVAEHSAEVLAALAELQKK